MRKAHSLLSGVALFPVVGNGVGRPDQPLFVASKLLQDSLGKNFVLFLARWPSGFNQPAEVLGFAVNLNANHELKTVGPFGTVAATAVLWQRQDFRTQTSDE